MFHMPRMSANRQDSSSGDGSVQAVALAFEMVEHLAAHREAVGVTALAKSLGMTKSRVHRYLRTLVQLGYVTQTGDEKYGVGDRLGRMARRMSEKFDLGRIAEPALRELRDTLGHFSVVSGVEADGMRVLATASANSMMEIGVKRGALLGFHYSAQGKLALAFGDAALAGRVLGAPLEQLSPKTLTDPRALKREIARIKKQGWAVAPDEATLGVNALAAPIFDAGRTLVGTIAVLDSIQHLRAEPSEEQIRQVQRAAGDVSAILGYAEQAGT
jgi:IclR family transcriptional regulator, KDG regulon repressor